MREELKEGGVVRGHNKVTSVSKDYGRWQLGVRVDCTVNTVTDSHKVGGKTHSNVFAFIDWTCFINCSNHDSTVITIAYLHKLNIRIDINVRIFASLYSDILILKSRFFYSDTFIQAVHINDLSFRLVRRNNLTEPINYDVHVDFNRVTPSLKEWCQSWELNDPTSCNSWFQPTCLLNFEKDPQRVEFGGTKWCFRTVNIWRD